MQTLRRTSAGLCLVCLLLGATGRKSGKAAPDSAVDLNSATRAELESVPGIGEARSKKILMSRPYTSVADLTKAGFSAKQIMSLRSMVKVGSGVEEAGAPAASKPAARVMRRTPAAGGGRGLVWVNAETGVFHRQGDKYYGLTKHGRFMAEADAIAAGYQDSKSP